MIEILRYLKDPKLWELWYISYYMGNAGFIPSTVGVYTTSKVSFRAFGEFRGLGFRGLGFRI